MARTWELQKYMQELHQKISIPLLVPTDFEMVNMTDEYKFDYTPEANVEVKLSKHAYEINIVKDSPCEEKLRCFIASFNGSKYPFPKPKVTNDKDIRKLCFPIHILMKNKKIAEYYGWDCDKGNVYWAPKF